MRLLLVSVATSAWRGHWDTSLGFFGKLKLLCKASVASMKANVARAKILRCTIFFLMLKLRWRSLSIANFSLINKYAKKITAAQRSKPAGVEFEKWNPAQKRFSH